MPKNFPPELQGVKYKIWAQVERCDYEADEYTNIGEPEELGAYDTEEEAFAALTEITGVPNADK